MYEVFQEIWNGFREHPQALLFVFIWLSFLTFLGFGCYVALSA